MKFREPFVVRKKIIWMGPEPDAAIQTEFTNRELALYCTNSEISDADLCASSGIIFRYNSAKPGAVRTQLELLARKAADHGLAVIAIAEDTACTDILHKYLKELDLESLVYLRTNPTTHEIPHRIATHDPGWPLHPSLSISGDTDGLDECGKLLLGRAFTDCSSLYIKKLSGGYSASVFAVSARFRDPIAGPRPLPFFAKIDERTKIEEEGKKYSQYVQHFIPFSSRPNLDEDRCILGGAKGILVGNFVEQSESLWDVVRRGTAQTPLYSLFDRALAGWRLQAFENEPSNTSPFDSLSNQFKPTRVTVPRLTEAKRLGAVKTPQQIFDSLRNLPSIPFRKGPVHGDLHADNVRIRSIDAILIDFASVFHGPIVADPAALEVSIAFRFPVEERENETWKSMIDTLYLESNLMSVPPPAREPLPREWLWTTVRQIRLIALASQVSPYEYQFALVIYLLRWAMYPPDVHDEEYRRAYAYVVAERLCDRLLEKLRPV